MEITTLSVDAASLAEYSAIPMSFEVSSQLALELVDDGLGGVRFTEERVDPPWTKDYDARDGEGPTRWPRRFDTGNWLQFLARDDAGMAVGGAIVAWRTAGVDMLVRRDDLAVLWDLRVRPDVRRSGIGRSLFAAVAEWARAHDCTQLKIETQNINVRACRFYAAQGCRLGEVNRFAYWGDPVVAGEVMLIWYLDL